MLSKSQAKYIRSLSQQKFRKEHEVYLAEGVKIAEEWLLSDEKIEFIVGTNEWIKNNGKLINRHPESELHEVTDAELEALSSQPSPNQVLLVVKMQPSPALPQIKEWCLALDNIRDPGNMGSIIRIADWFGIRHIVCSPGCAEAYSPKVIQSAMGGQLRVNIYETDLEAFLKNVKIPVLAATLDGENIHQVKKPAAAVVIIGNESKGVAPNIVALATQKVMIPRRGGAESLNAAVSAGIICSMLIN